MMIFLVDRTLHLMAGDAELQGICGLHARVETTPQQYTEHNQHQATDKWTPGAFSV